MNVRRRLGSFVVGVVLLGAVVALPGTAGAFPSDVPKPLRDEHMKLPRNIRHPVEVMYQQLRQLGEYLQRGDEMRAKKSIAQAEQWWRDALKAAGADAMNRYPIMRKHFKSLQDGKASIAGGLAAVEKTGCPKDKYRNAGLKRVLRGPLLGMFDRKDCSKRDLPSSVRACRALKERLKKFSITGRPTTKYNAYRRTYTERVVVWACVHQQKRGEKEVCRALQVSIQRTKVKGRRWSAWKTYGVGSVQRIGCRTLK